MSTDPFPKRDHRQEVTDQIIRMLEEGTAPWQKPWRAGGLELPFNPATGKPYRGGNAVHLMGSGMAAGYDDPRWMTLKQAGRNSWQVRKGEQGTHIEYWEFRNSAPGVPEESPERSPGDNRRDPRRFIHRVYTVFNASQVDGVPEHTPKQHKEVEIVQAGENILERSGARIRHDQSDRAFYDRSSDSIHLPPRTAFHTAPDYYGTALHELAHWSGHPDRLNRRTLNDSQSFGDDSYAREELRAELASVLLSAERGIPHDPAKHAAYVGSWIRALRDDRHEIFRAGSDAHRATDFLLALERGRSVESDASGGTRDPHRREVKGVMPTPEDVRTSFTEAGALGKARLGDHARIYAARTGSGVYGGEILDQTRLHVVQRLTGNAAVAHLKDGLPNIPLTGKPVLITYSRGRARVQDIPVRPRSKELAR